MAPDDNDYPKTGVNGVEDKGTAHEAVTSRDFAKGLGTTLLARLGGVIEVVSQPVYVWLFGLASYGLYAVLWATVNLIENIADLGMTSSLQRVVPQAKDEQEAVCALRSAFILGVVPCLVLALLGYLFAPSLTHIFNVAPSDEDALITSIELFVWALPLWAFVEIGTSALRARRVFGAEIRLRVFWEQIIRLALAVGFFAIGFDIVGLLIAHLASLAIICLLTLRLLARYYDLRLLLRGRLIDPVFAETFRAGLAILPANILSRLFGDAPPIVLNAMLPGAAGATSAALYTIARKVSSIVQMVRIAFGYVLSPLASVASRGGKQAVRPIYGFATRLTFVIAVPLAVIMAANGNAILDLFGPDADDAHAALVALILARMAEAIFAPAIAVQQVIGGYRQQVLASAIGFAVAASIAVPLVSALGLLGMALATGAGFLVAALVPLVQVRWYDGLHPFDPPFARVAIRTTAISVALLPLVLIAIALLPNWGELVVITIINAAAIWLACRYALPIEDRKELGKTGRKLRLID